MRYLVAGGGTGGHLFPGIAAAEALRELDPSAELLFLCTTRPFDRDQLTAGGLPFQAMEAPRLPRDLTGMSLLPWQLFRTCREAMDAVRRFRPDAVLGLGGYGSFPALVAARLRGIPILLLEQNVLPGRVTRLAAPWAEAVLSGWAETSAYLAGDDVRVETVGIPLRCGVAGPGPGRAAAAARFGFDPGRTTLLVAGGSQGAEGVNRFVAEALGRTAPRDLQVIHLCGASAVETVATAYRGLPYAARVHPFWNDMGAAYAAADLAVARAGGSTLAELAARGLPAVLLPYPHAADNHQTYNAEAVSRAGGAVTIAPHEEATLGRTALRWLLWDPEARRKMSTAMRALGRPDAARTVAARALAAARAGAFAPRPAFPPVPRLVGGSLRRSGFLPRRAAP